MVAIQSQILTTTHALAVPPQHAPAPDQKSAPTTHNQTAAPPRADVAQVSDQARRASGEPDHHNAPAPGAANGPEGEPLTPDQQRELDELKKRDAEVRAHEQAHVAAAGPYFQGGPTYETQRGPDGRDYAVGGSVQIDSNPVPGDPEATIAKMQQVRRAALAPADPSAQDRKVAARASQLETKARQELAEEQSAAATENNTGEEPDEGGVANEQEQDDQPKALDLAYNPKGNVGKLQVEHLIDLTA